MPQQQEVETDDFARLSPRDYLQLSHEVLNHPMLLAIVEAAPSPKAADEQIRSLGFPNDLAQKVRAGVYARNKFGEKGWALVKPTAKRAAHSMLVFPEDIPDKQMVPALAWKFDQTIIDCSAWPVLLREYIHSDASRSAKVSTTVDGDGKSCYFSSARDKSLSELCEANSHNLHNNDAQLEWLNADVRLSVHGLHISSKKGFGFSFNVGVVCEDSRLVADQFPRFHKVVEIKHQAWRGELSERIRFAMRIDRPYFKGESGDKVGFMTFECWLPFDGDWQERLYLPYSVHYYSPNRFTAVFDPKKFFQGCLVVEIEEKARMRNYNTGIFVPSSLTASVHDYLLHVAEKMCRVPSINLETLLGEDILLKQPKRLIDLFAEGIPEFVVPA